MVVTAPVTEPEGWISADSHLVELPNTYSAGLPLALRDRAPHVACHERLGDVYVIPGLPHPVPLGFARPSDPDSRVAVGPRAVLADLRPGGAEPEARLQDQDRDGVRAEILYPTVGLAVLRQPDLVLRRACAGAYNEWMQSVCAAAPDRLHGVAILAPCGPEDAPAEVRRAVGGGAAGLLASVQPEGVDYHDPVWSPFFDAVVATGLPLSFHALGSPARASRGPALAALATQGHEAQELLATLIFGGVLDRWPTLPIVLAEYDASWVGHLASRMDRLADTHHGWGTPTGQSDRRPSEVIDAQVHLAFANDPLALSAALSWPSGRLMWGNDYPHAEGTWPRSRELLAGATARVAQDRLAAFTSGTAAHLYGLAP